MRYFTDEELACPTTGLLITEDGFLEELDELRHEYGSPMVVTSCCRSLEHNTKVGGHPTSFHLIGNSKYGTNTCAIDIKRPEGPRLFRLLKLASKRDWTIGIADTFVHLDLRSRYTDRLPTVYTY